MGSGKTQVPALCELIWAMTCEMSCKYGTYEYWSVVYTSTKCLLTYTVKCTRVSLNHN